MSISALLCIMGMIYISHETKPEHRIFLGATFLISGIVVSFLKG